MAEGLFSPLTVRGTTLPNRVMVSPMCQYSAPGGFPTDWHLVHLGSRAVGGAGLVMAEATAVEKRGRICSEDLGIWSDEHGEALERIASFVADQGSVPGIQLAHAGRKASKTRPWEGNEPVKPDDGGWETVAPSANPYPYEEHPEQPTTRLSQAEIEGVVQSFADGARRAREAGFEAVEIHAAHGYLIHEFLSPVVNDREDEYGGSFENRTRFIREVTRAVREEWPSEQPVFVRISATDWLEDRESWDVEQSARLAPMLAEAGADLIDVSSGGICPEQKVLGSTPGYQLPYAETIREHLHEEGVDALVGAVGAITEPVQAEQIVANDQADAVLLGREMLKSPYWTREAALELDGTEQADWPIQYGWAE